MKQKVKQLLPIAGVMVAALIFSFLPAEGSQRTDIKEAAESLFDTEFRSNRLRMTYWDASFQMIKENPLMGIGLMKWSGYYPKYFGKEFNDNTIFYMQSTHAHNDFLELFAENGFLSPLLYLFILFLILKSIFKKSKTNSIYFFISLSVISTAIFSLIAFPLYKLSSHFVLSVCTGIALFEIKHNEKKSVMLKFKHLKIVFIVILSIVIITSFIKLKSELNYIDSLDFMNRKSFVKMNEKLNDVEKVLIIQETNLKEHMRRSEHLEKLVEIESEKRESAEKKMEKHINMVEGGLKLIGIIGVLVGIFAGIAKIISLII
jgi:O-antigen ligase